MPRHKGDKLLEITPYLVVERAIAVKSGFDGGEFIEDVFMFRISHNVKKIIYIFI